jgi:hypothetical protein
MRSGFQPKFSKMKPDAEPCVHDDIDSSASVVADSTMPSGPQV